MFNFFDETGPDISNGCMVFCKGKQELLEHFWLNASFLTWLNKEICQLFPITAVTGILEIYKGTIGPRSLPWVQNDRATTFCQEDFFFLKFYYWPWKSSDRLSNFDHGAIIWKNLREVHLRMLHIIYLSSRCNSNIFWHASFFF